MTIRLGTTIVAGSARDQAILTADNAFTGTNTFNTQTTSDDSQKAATTGFVHDILEVLFPVGGLYFTTVNTTTCPLLTLMPNTTWALVSTNRAIWGGDGTNATNTIDSALPNITGITGQSDCAAFTYNPQTSGAFYSTGDSLAYFMGRSSQSTNTNGRLGFNASRSSSVYKDGQTTVQPPAYVTNIWRRAT